MSHQTEFETIFIKFMEKFPPAKSKDDCTLKLTTEEFTEAIQGFHPDVELPNLFAYMTTHGYFYEPFEYNERITFYWLLKQAE
jgi:hypothetical protein